MNSHVQRRGPDPAPRRWRYGRSLLGLSVARIFGQTALVGEPVAADLIPEAPDLVVVGCLDARLQLEQELGALDDLPWRVGRWVLGGKSAVPSVLDFETKLVARMTKLAEQHPRWGYRMVHGLLVEEGWPVNKKRIERLWRQEGLQVPPQRLKSQWAESNQGGREQCVDAAGAATEPCVVLRLRLSADRRRPGRCGSLNVLDEHTRGRWEAMSLAASGRRR